MEAGQREQGFGFGIGEACLMGHPDGFLETFRGQGMLAAG